MHGRQTTVRFLLLLRELADDEAEGGQGLVDVGALS